MTKAKNDDLLSDIGATEQSGEVIDLLDDIDENEAVAWVAQESGDGIQGIVTKRSTQRSDYKDQKTGDYPDCPVVELIDKDGVPRRIVGFSGTLRDVINENDPQPGDLFAVKYLGKKEGKNFNYHLYKGAKRAGTGPVSPPPVSSVPPF